MALPDEGTNPLNADLSPWHQMEGDNGSSSPPFSAVAEMVRSPSAHKVVGDWLNSKDGGPTPVSIALYIWMGIYPWFFLAFGNDATGCVELVHTQHCQVCCTQHSRAEIFWLSRLVSCRPVTPADIGAAGDVPGLAYRLGCFLVFITQFSAFHDLRAVTAPKGQLSTLGAGTKLITRSAYRNVQMSFFSLSGLCFVMLLGVTFLNKHIVTGEFDETVWSVLTAILTTLFFWTFMPAFAMWYGTMVTAAAICNQDVSKTDTSAERFVATGTSSTANDEQFRTSVEEPALVLAKTTLPALSFLRKRCSTQQSLV
jgi:hypothetical protein